MFSQSTSYCEKHLSSSPWCCYCTAEHLQQQTVPIMVYEKTFLQILSSCCHQSAELCLSWISSQSICLSVKFLSKSYFTCSVQHELFTGCILFISLTYYNSQLQQVPSGDQYSVLFSPFFIIIIIKHSKRSIIHALYLQIFNSCKTNIFMSF